mgnify:CR=1 FL=1
MWKKIRNILIIILIVSVLAGISYYLYTTYNKIDITPEYEIKRIESTVPLQTVDNVEQKSQTVADMLEKVSQSVVGISKIKTRSNSIFSSSNSINELGLGTGIIVSNNGYILSNCHVTGEKSSTCYVTLENGATYEGSVVWCDSDLDLSITKINANNLNYATIGDSSNIKSGETVYAIGNPIGYEFRRTITLGIISATNRTVKIEENNSVSYMTDLIQTDASINPGNSGGPLINPYGEVIGVNTVKITTAEGIGFAVPINVVKPVIEKFVTTNKFDESVTNFSNQFKFMNSKKKTVIKIFIIATIQSFLYYSLTYIVYRAFGNSGISYFQIVPAQAFLLLIMTFIPTPGSGIGAEGGFLLIFNSIFKQGTINMAILFWRLYTFYLPIIIGALFLIPVKKSKTNINNV